MGKRTKNVRATPNETRWERRQEIHHEAHRRATETVRRTGYLPGWIAHRGFTPIVPVADDALVAYARAHKVAAE